MNKKILITIGILVLLISSVFIVMKIGERLDVGKCRTDRDCRFVKCPGAYCDNGKCVCPMGGVKKLSDVKVASIYERVTDGVYYLNRSVDDVTNLFKETKTDFIFRGWWRWKPTPESPVDSSGLFTPDRLEEATKRGLTYEHLRNATVKIDKEMPDAIFCGAVGSQYLRKHERNPMTDKIIRYPDTWEMALDPEKLGIDVSKKEFQKWFAVSQQVIEPTTEYDPEKAPFYFPDITNENYQELFLSWAKKQIDCGADAIWIDMLFHQAALLSIKTGDPNHPAVKKSFEASSKIVNDIHKYGESRGRKIYVGTWADSTTLPYSQPNLDFVTTSPSCKEINSMKLNETRWDEKVERIGERLGDIPIFAFIDFGTDTLPLATFSQTLSHTEQREFLEYADEFFQEKGINFIYPMHGGNMGVKDVEILSFGEFNVYDSFAPEFQTYETIKELALEKAGKPIEPIEPEVPVKSGKLSDVNVASFYQTITDGDIISRSIDEATTIFKETKTDMIFRGFWRWNPVPQSLDLLVSSEFPDEYVKEAGKRGYTYQQLRDAIDKIKTDIPNILFTGAVTTQRLNKFEWNPVTNSLVGQKETWEMAFNPEKWNLGVSKQETQCKLTKSWNWISSGIECPKDYNPENVSAYFPDITNEKYQELFLSWAKKQIDYGADIIWIDMLFKQANLIEKSYPGHVAVKESLEASSKIVDEIHKYGKLKDKQIYVGSWITFAKFSYFPPNIDFVTASPSSEEVLNKKLNLSDWNNIKLKVEAIEKKLGKDIPVFVFIDVGNDKLPIAAFGQKTTSAEQGEFLEYADNFFNKLDMNFVYPIHGGFMGQNAKILSFGISKNYDSLAPEFQTYETIKELALEKAGE